MDLCKEDLSAWHNQLTVEPIKGVDLGQIAGVQPMGMPVHLVFYVYTNLRKVSILVEGNSYDFSWIDVCILPISNYIYEEFALIATSLHMEVNELQKAIFDQRPKGWK